MKLTSHLRNSLVDIELAKVRALSSSGRLDEAREIIQPLYENSPKDNMVLLIYAEYLMRAKNYLEAHKILNESLKINNTNFYTLKLIAEVYFLQEDYETALKTFLVAEKSITPSPTNEYVEVVYYIGLCYYRQEKFREAGIYLFYAQRLNHTFRDLFHITSELTVINNIFKSYERQKNDHWFLLAAFKTFRRYGHKIHQEKFMNEIKEKHPKVLDYELIKLDLEICDLVDRNASKEEFQKIKPGINEEKHVLWLFIYFP